MNRAERHLLELRSGRPTDGSNKRDVAELCLKDGEVSSPDSVVGIIPGQRSRQFQSGLVSFGCTEIVPCSHLKVANFHVRERQESIGVARIADT